MQVSELIRLSKWYQTNIVESELESAYQYESFKRDKTSLEIFWIKDKSLQI